MLIDTHSHLNFNAFKRDYDEVIKRSLAENVWIINVGSQYETSKRAVEIAEKYPEGVYAAIGLHPIHLETGLVKIKNDKEETEIKTSEEGFDYQNYKALAKSKRVVAIGEIGLDYYWKPKTAEKRELFKQRQKASLLKQLDLAKELNLPVIFHCRMAHQDLLEVIFNFQLPITQAKRRVEDGGKLRRRQTSSPSKLQGVIHCFTGSREQAKKYLEMGLYLGFNGIIFKKIERIDFEETIKYVPLDKVLIETDCPYLTPPPMSGRNESLYLKYIAQRIAKIKNLSYEEIVKATTENARKLFNI